jgi:hypothetical protein
MYCPKCGTQASPSDRFCGGCGAPLPAQSSARPSTQPVAGDREALLVDIERALSRHPQLQLSRGPKSDLEIKNILADHKLLGKKVEFQASLLARESDHTVVYWEIFKEYGMGLGSFGGFKVESYRSDGKTASGSVREVDFGPTGKTVDYKLDYARIRSVVEGVVRDHGWKFETTLRKGKTEQ